MSRLIRSISARALAAYVVILVAATALVSTPAAMAQADPSVSASMEPDIARAGSEFTLELHNMNLASPFEWVSVYVYKDGRYIADNPWGDATEVRCVPDADPSNDPSITDTCTFFLAARAAGVYDLEVYVGAPGIDETFFVTSTLDADIPAWWNEFEVVEKETSRFTGYTNLTIRFDSVPPEVPSLTLEAWTDSDNDGYLDGISQTVGCTDEGSGVFTCATGGSRIPPLCIADDIAGQYCDDGDFYYSFHVNGIGTSYGYTAILYRLSRLDEGRFFGRQDYESGRPLHDFLDLDTFVFASLEPCYYQNNPNCYDLGYYDTWLMLYGADLARLMSEEGRLAVAIDGDTATIEAFVPRLPLGTNGFRATVAHWPDGDPAAVEERDLSCDESACTDIVIVGLDPGDHRFAINVHNDHPLIEIEDENGELVPFGQSVFASDRLPSVATVAATAPAIIDLTGPSEPVATRAEVTLTATFDAADGGPHTAVWEWGDGTTTTRIVEPGADVPAARHRYARPGLYSAALTVTDADGDADRRTVDVPVYDRRGRAAYGSILLGDPPAKLATGEGVALAFGARRWWHGAVAGRLSLDVSGPASLRLRSRTVDDFWVFTDWAQIRGTGALDDGTEIDWLLTVVDGGRAGPDTVRVKVSKVGELASAVYDTMPGAGDFERPQTPVDVGFLRIRRR